MADTRKNRTRRNQKRHLFNLIALRKISRISLVTHPDPHRRRQKKGARQTGFVFIGLFCLKAEKQSLRPAIFPVHQKREIEREAKLPWLTLTRSSRSNKTMNLKTCILVAYLLHHQKYKKGHKLEKRKRNDLKLCKVKLN